MDRASRKWDKLFGFWDYVVTSTSVKFHPKIYCTYCTPKFWPGTQEKVQTLVQKTQKWHIYLKIEFCIYFKQLPLRNILCQSYFEWSYDFKLLFLISLLGSQNYAVTEYSIYEDLILFWLISSIIFWINFLSVQINCSFIQSEKSTQPNNIALFSP